MKPNPIADLARRDPHCRDELAAAIARCIAKRGRHAGQLADRNPQGDYTHGVYQSLLSTAAPGRGSVAFLIMAGEHAQRGFNECEAWQKRKLEVPNTDRHTIRVATAVAYLIGAPLRFNLESGDSTIRDTVARLVQIARETRE